jgi:hypothetical protein
MDRMALGTRSSRLEKSWMVHASHQTDEATRCVGIFIAPDGTYGFEEFRGHGRVDTGQLLRKPATIGRGSRSPFPL